MFGDFLRRLTAPDPSRLPDADARPALTALLVRIARSDNDYAASEVAQIDDIIRHRYGLSDAGARELREQAEALEAEAPDTVRFTRAIKDAVPYEDRRSCASPPACSGSKTATAPLPDKRPNEHDRHARHV